eukprot:Pgem_evm1s4392
MLSVYRTILLIIIIIYHKSIDGNSRNEAVNDDTGKNLKIIENSLNIIKQNTKATDISLRGCNMGDVGITELARKMKHNYKITFLNLYGNCINCEGAIEIAKMLMVNKSLSFLILEYNTI